MNVVKYAWCQTLSRPTAGPEDDFFESGGHSLLAVHLVKEIYEASGVEIPLAQLYLNPTLGGLQEVYTELSSQSGDHAPRAEQPDLAALLSRLDHETDLRRPE